MSQNKSLQSKMPLAMGLAFVAFTTQFGGGFASGAQIYQYFINYGIWCLILPAVTQGLYALFFWYGMRYAYKHKTYDYRSFSDSLYGKTKPVMSNLYEICYLIRSELHQQQPLQPAVPHCRHCSGSHTGSVH